jgi:uncharacterized oxidoreductase
MTAFPIALIPTFLVPLSIGLHLVSLRFLLSASPRRWQASMRHSRRQGDDKMDLHHRRILITGGGSGIGLELARLLAVDNQVVVAGRDPEKLRHAAAGVDRLETTQFDVTSEASSRAAMEWVLEHIGGLDLLVNAAGVLNTPSLETDADGRAAEDEVAVNLLGSLRMTRLALPHLRRAEDGAVVFVSSALALTASPGLATYAASKAAVHSLARSLRAELAGQVRVFDVLPPFVDTQLARSFGGAKLSTLGVAADIVDGLRRDRLEIRIGRVKALATVGRIWPSMADRIIAGELAFAGKATAARADP